LETFLDRVRRQLRFPDDSVTIRLVSAAAIARLNRTFRGKRGPTDVLSFPADGKLHGLRRKRQMKPAGGSSESDAASYVGDIAIAPSAARRNARLYGRTLPEELRILLLHGMIHLAGYDHERDNGQMVRFEQRLRHQFGLGAGRIKRQ
jgi:probable rRNA maturation factor